MAHVMAGFANSMNGALTTLSAALLLSAPTLGLISGSRTSPTKAADKLAAAAITKFKAPALHDGRCGTLLISDKLYKFPLQGIGSLTRKVPSKRVIVGATLTCIRGRSYLLLQVTPVNE
jgi:hypothetical protein